MASRRFGTTGQVITLYALGEKAPSSSHSSHSVFDALNRAEKRFGR